MKEKGIVERLINLREYVLYMEKRLKLFKVVGITPRIAFYSVELSKITPSASLHNDEIFGIIANSASE